MDPRDGLGSTIDRQSDDRCDKLAVDRRSCLLDRPTTVQFITMSDIVGTVIVTETKTLVAVQK